jgi:hypothetical protein
MICGSCKEPIGYSDLGQPCPGFARRHVTDNRHKPLGRKCPCGGTFEGHRVSHEPKGEPCMRCGLPAASHVVRKFLNRSTTRQVLRQRDGWKCQLCGDAFDDPSPVHPDRRSVTIDHIVQVWKGGTDDLANLRLVHRICNMKRNGEELSPRQQQANANAIEKWRTILGSASASMSDGQVMISAFTLIGARLAKKK